MFIVAFGKDGINGHHGLIYHVEIARAETLEEARDLRKLNGDLVFYENGNIVQDPSWLWEEKDLNGRSVNAYAKRCIELKYRLL